MIRYWTNGTWHYILSFVVCLLTLLAFSTNAIMQDKDTINPCVNTQKFAPWVNKHIFKCGVIK